MKQVRTAPPIQPIEPTPQEPSEPEHPIVGKANSEEKAAELTKDHTEARDEAIELFTTGGGVIKTEETQKALDSLADNIEPTDVTNEQEPSEPEHPIVGKANSEEKSSQLIDYAEEAALPMFDVPLDDDDDEVSVDDEYITEEPLELP
jgi:hypothetical protein